MRRGKIGEESPGKEESGLEEVYFYGDLTRRYALLLADARRDYRSAERSYRVRQQIYLWGTVLANLTGIYAMVTQDWTAAVSCFSVGLAGHVYKRDAALRWAEYTRWYDAFVKDVTTKLETCMHKAGRLPFLN